MKSLVIALVAVASIGSGAAAQAPASAATLKQDMRKLWTEHVFWTRDYVIAALADSPAAEASAARLMRNQEDIGNAVGVYYGAAAGSELTRLLKEHITIAVDVVKVAKAGDKAALGAADGRWQKIADAIVKQFPGKFSG